MDEFMQLYNEIVEGMRPLSPYWQLGLGALTLIATYLAGKDSGYESASKYTNPTPIQVNPQITINMPDENDDDEFEMARFSNHCENNYMTQQDNMDNMDNMDNHDYMMPHDIFRQHNFSQQHMLQQHNPRQHFSRHHNNSQHMMQNFMRHDQYVMPRANSPFVPNDKNPHYVDLSKKNMMRV